MNIDDAGHHYGNDSAEYRNTTRKVDIWLSHLLPQWLEQDYQVIITADHGMNDDCSHGGDLAIEREVPLFIFGSLHQQLHQQTIEQVDFCRVVCELLNIPYQSPDLLTEQPKVNL